MRNYGISLKTRGVIQIQIRGVSPLSRDQGLLQVRSLLESIEKLLESIEELLESIEELLESIEELLESIEELIDV